jgi:hypothetical protein
MDDSSEILTFTFDEANHFFGLSESNGVLLLKAISERQEHHFSPRIHYELRFLVIAIQVLMEIESEEVRYLVRSLNSSFLREQFKGKSSIESSSLHYIFTLIWHYRHCRNLNDVETVDRDPVFLSRFKQQLILAGIAVHLEFSFS